MNTQLALVLPATAASNTVVINARFESGFAQQTKVARALSIAERTVRRYQERYAQDGMVGLGREADDRIFDRELTYLGLLDDAAPIFRDGCEVPGVGVLLALPCLIESGVLSIARKLYGDIGPAFYGLHTTLLTLMVMALLRIQRASVDSWDSTGRRSRPCAGSRAVWPPTTRPMSWARSAR